MVPQSSSIDRPSQVWQASQSASELESPESAVLKSRKAERVGAEATDILTRVFRLEDHDKTDDAKHLRSTIPLGK